MNLILMRNKRSLSHILIESKFKGLYEDIGCDYIKTINLPIREFMADWKRVVNCNYLVKCDAFNGIEYVG